MLDLVNQELCSPKILSCTLGTRCAATAPIKQGSHRLFVVPLSTSQMNESQSTKGEGHVVGWHQITCLNFLGTSKS